MSLPSLAHVIIIVQPTDHRHNVHVHVQYFTSRLFIHVHLFNCACTHYCSPTMLSIPLVLIVECVVLHLSCRPSIQMCTEDHGEERTAETLLHRLSATVIVLLVREGGREEGREGEVK